jgi:hypothetical protein
LGVPEVLGAPRASLAPEDDSPPHVTFLVIGDVRGREGALLALLRECVARQPAACWAVLGALNVAKNTEGRTVAFQDVRFSGGRFDGGGDWALANLRCEIVRALRAASFPLKDHSPDDWRAHFTRAYLPDGAEVYAEPRIEGAFEVSRLEVWGLPEVAHVSLQSPALLSTAGEDAEGVMSLSKSLLNILAPPDPSAAFPIPAWMGELLSKAILKGRSHKYIRKIPTGKTGKTGKPLYRYYYTVTGGHGLGHEQEIVRGAAFAIKDAGTHGHFHIEAVDGDRVTIKHDESGKSHTVTRAALQEMLRREHAEPLRQAQERAAATLEQAKKTGTKKQQDRAAALVSKYSEAKKRPAATIKEINAALKADPVAALKRYGQDMAGQTLQAKITQVDGDSRGSRTGAKIKTTKQRLIVLGSTPEGLRVLSSQRKRKDPAPHESTYYYDNKILPWENLSSEAPSLEERGENWREAQDRIKIEGASLDSTSPAHSLGFAEIQQAAESMDPKAREAWWRAVASPEDAALLASSPQGVQSASFNIYRHLRDAGASVDAYSHPGTHRLMRGGRTVEQTNREEAATVAELIRTGKPSSASVEAAAQKAFDEKATPLYLVNTERMQREILRQQAAEARSVSVTKAMSRRMDGVSTKGERIPAWMGALLSRAITKGRAHKYIRKVPTGKAGKSGKPLYRYYYTVTGGHGLGAEKEIVQGAAFRIKSGGVEGHFHVEAVDGNNVTVRHDESGKVHRMSKIALAGMMHAEHAEAMTDAKSRAHQTLEEARKTGSKRQVERAEQHAAKFGPVPQVAVQGTPSKEEPKEASAGQGVYQFEPMRPDDFKGLWTRRSDKAAYQKSAADGYNKVLDTLSKQLHEAMPDSAEAKQEFDRYAKQLKAAWNKWADRDGVLADILHPSSIYDSAHKRELAHKAQTERLALMDEAKKIAPRLQRAEQKAAKDADPMGHAKAAAKEAQDKLDRMEGLNAVLKTVANPEAKAKRFAELGLTDAEVKEYGRSGVPTATLKYLKQRAREADRRVYDLEYEETMAQRRAQGLNKSLPVRSLAAELAALL